MNPVIKKLQLKEPSKPILIVQAPKEYEEVISAFEAEVHQSIQIDSYPFIQVFGISIESLQEDAKNVIDVLENDGLLWLCYPKKSSKVYKGSDCSRDTVAPLLADFGYEPVRQVAIDEDWSALRFRKVEHIKKMTRKFAATDAGKARTKHQSE
ncbi:DUF3052 domain-containing protein [Halalkalibacter urbisdiaboli]|uniref:DUF3052 domain-containing protein n=1 Tax=Halalkalibacter urbisdiaboli TaxID=1960589 RepID=UPI000B4540F7|nr:DUF3052 domain-containing protein [Halalkalibacter urbisdiaboli]